MKSALLDKRLRPGERVVLQYIREHHPGEQRWDVDRVAHVLGIRRAAIFTHVRRLIDIGLVTKHHCRSDKRHIYLKSL